MIETTITASVLILIIAALRQLLRGKISSRLQYALWMLAAVRLLLPFPLFESPVSVMNAIPDTQVYALATVQPAAPANPDDMVLPGNASAVPQSGHAAPDHTANTPNIKTTAQFVWLGGILLTGIFFAVSGIRLNQKLKRSRRRMEAPGYPLPVYIADSLPSPCLYGLVRPAVYLTPESLSNEKRSMYVMAHELTHYRHKDHLWSFIRVLCLCIHWFNPLAWLAAILSRRDSELACDEGTLQKLGDQNRIEYGRAIIEMTTAPLRPSNLFCCATTMTGGKREMTERIRRIAKQPKMLVITLAAVVVVAVAAVAVTFGGAARKTPIVLPQSDSVASVMIERIDGGESLGAIRIFQKTDVERVLNALSDTDRTLRDVANAVPDRGDYFRVDIDDSPARCFYLYHDGEAYYVEEPDVGIYRASREAGAAIAKIYAGNSSADSTVDAQALWEARTSYVGDNSAVGKLLGLLPLPEGLRRDHFILRTTGNERGIEWVLKGDEAAFYKENSLNLDALLLFALVDNLQDFYVTMKDPMQHETTFRYDRAWADETAGRDVREYAENPEKLQEMLELYGTENDFAQYSIARLGKNGKLLDGYFVADQQLASAIIIDYMVKSAAWEGVDITTLEECYLIRQIFPEANETHDYYAYLKEDGTAVLQSGTDGWYSVLSPELYSELVKSVEILATDAWLENQYTEGILRPNFDNMLWMTTDYKNEYCAACYQAVSREQMEQYLRALHADGWQTVRDLYEHMSLGGRYQKGNHTISIQFDDDQVVLYFSLK